MENLTFTHVCKVNAAQFKALYRHYPPYKIETLKHHGESPYGRKSFLKLLEYTIQNAASNLLDDKNQHFVVMHTGKKLLGFAVFSINVNEPVNLTYSYGYVNDFFIVPKFRRKGYGCQLNRYMESIFAANGTRFVLLHPDPITGILFWKATGYTDTGLNTGYGRYAIYKKHLSDTHHIEIAQAIASKIMRTDFMTVNPYNKAQIHELKKLWINYWHETTNHRNEKCESQRKVKKRLKNRVMYARKTPKSFFCALYFKSKIIGFSQFGIFSGSSTLQTTDDYGFILEFYIDPAFRRQGFGADMNHSIETMFLHEQVSAVYLTPDIVTGIPFWASAGYTNSGITETDTGKPLYVKNLNSKQR